MGIGSSIPRFANTVIHQIKQDSFKDGKSCNASPFFKIEARRLGDRVRFFAQVAAGTPWTLSGRSCCRVTSGADASKLPF